MIVQWFNLMAVRTRRVSFFENLPWSKGSKKYSKKKKKKFSTFNFFFFQHNFKNSIALLPALLGSLLFSLIVIYVPFFNDLFKTRSVPIELWFMPMCGGLLLFTLEEIRKAINRRFPKSIIAKMAW